MKKIYTATTLFLFAVCALAQSPRTVLLETKETTQLEAVGEGICMKEQVKGLYGPNLAIISMHDDNIFDGGDPMYRPFVGDWATFFAPAIYPAGLVDRVSYNGNDLNLGLSLWVDTIAARINRTTDALVTLPEVLYDDNENEIFVRMQVNYTKLNIENREMRFFLYLVQDGVIADQRIDTTGGAAPCSLFSDTIDTAFNFSHEDVAIANPSGFDGIDNILPLQTDVGMQYTTSFAFPVPDGVSIDDVRVVGFVAEYTPSSVSDNKVVNAAKSETFTLYDSNDPSDPNHPDNPDNPNSASNPSNWPSSINEAAAAPSIAASVYPNPITDLGVIEFHLPAREVIDVSVYDVTGKMVRSIYQQELAEGRQLAAISAFDFEPGTYFVRIAGKGFIEQVLVIIAR